MLDSPDPRALADFYQILLGWTLTQTDSDWVMLRPPSGGTGLSFQAEPDFVPPVWPSGPGTQQMMIHLDIAVEDLKALMDALGIREAYVGGISMGGSLALHFGLRHPEMALALIVAAAGTGSTNPEESRCTVDPNQAVLGVEPMSTNSPPAGTRSVVPSSSCATSSSHSAPSSSAPPTTW